MEATDAFSYSQAIDVNKGDLMLINGYPCKIVDRTTSKTGKHGGCKINFNAQDIFTNKKYCMLHKSDDKVKVPNIIRGQYKIVDIEENNNDSVKYLFHLISNKGILRENVKILDNDNIEEIYDKFINDDKDIDITVMEYLDNIMIIQHKIL